MRTWNRFLALVLCSALAAPCLLAQEAESSAPAEPSPNVPWQVGLLRVRDLTPFGITRLDMLPAHAVPATPGTWALEVNLSYQNTYVLSPNVEEYLRESRGGGGRARLTQAEIDGILALPADAYYVDGELGLFDLTVHHRFDDHWGAYVTLPVFYYDGGFLDSSIEGFHEGVGLSTAGRDIAERNQFQFAYRVGEDRFGGIDAPDGGVGDPVVALRYSLVPLPERWQMVLEAAAKIPWDGERFLLSTGKPDFGTQISFQRWWRANALYLTLNGTYYAGTKSEPGDDEQVIPTALLGYEFRLTQRTNGILQLYASRSTVRDTTITELSDNKYQATLGVQTRRGKSVLRFAVTENLANFSNTPDVGLTLSYARVVQGRR